MNTIKQRVLSGWNFSRVIYLLLGSIMMIFGVVERQWAGLIAGGYFASMGLFAFGCAAGCFPGNYKELSKNSTEKEEINFEEIK